VDWKVVALPARTLELEGAFSSATAWGNRGATVLPHTTLFNAVLVLPPARWRPLSFLVSLQRQLSLACLVWLTGWGAGALSNGLLCVLWTLVVLSGQRAQRVLADAQGALLARIRWSKSD
jgi:hypothetical protein